VESVLTPDGKFFFLEVNARLQVEHPVTEMTTAVDLVEQQLRVAAGERIGLDRRPPRSGHSLECRVYAEDPRTFLPAPGRISRLDFGESARVNPNRYDFGYDTGDEVPMFYDPLIGKVVVHGGSRTGSIGMMVAALGDIRLDGLKTNIPALERVMRDERFVSGDYDTGLLGK